MVLIDASVVIELMKPSPDARLVAWVGRQPAASIFISTITEAELRHRVQLLPDSGKRQRLESSITAMMEEDFANRVLPFDGPAAAAYAEVAAMRQGMTQLDAQIAAIAKSRGAKLATRRAADFEGCGVEAINPWEK